MKIKKIISSAMLLCCGLSLSGCGGSLKDLNKQLEKVLDADEKNEIYGDEYRISTTKKTGSIEAVDMVMKKDGDKLYLYTKDSNFWIGKKNDKHYVFYSDENTKEYTEITEGKSQSLIAEIETKVQKFVTTQTKLVEEIVSYTKLCDKEKIACEIEKNMFGTEISFDFEREDGGVPQEFEVEIEKGKITEYYRKTIVSDKVVTTSTTFDYGNQEVKIPSNDGYTLNASVLSYLDNIGL